MPSILLTCLKVCDWSGHIFGASASPRSWTKKEWLCHPLQLFMAVSLIRNVTFELLMHAAFVADEIWGFMLEPARTSSFCLSISYRTPSRCRYPILMYVSYIPRTSSRTSSAEQAGTRPIVHTTYQLTYQLCRASRYTTHSTRYSGVYKFPRAPLRQSSTARFCFFCWTA